MSQVQFDFIEAAREYATTGVQASVAATLTIQGHTFPMFLQYFPGIEAAPGLFNPPFVFSGDFQSGATRLSPPVFTGSVSVVLLQAVTPGVADTVLVEGSLGTLHGPFRIRTYSYFSYWAKDGHLEGNLGSPDGAIEVVFGLLEKPAEAKHAKAGN